MKTTYNLLGLLILYTLDANLRSKHASHKQIVDRQGHIKSFHRLTNHCCFRVFVIKLSYIKNLRGFLSLLIASIVLGSFGIWIRFLSHDITSYQQIAFRNIIGFCIAVVILLVNRTKITFNKVPKTYLLAYTFSFPLTVVLYTLSLLITKIAVTTFALYIGSITASLFIGIIFFKEKMTKLKIFSLIFVCIGLLFFMMPLSKITLDLGLLLGLLSGVVESIANSFRKHLGNKVDRFTLVALSLLGNPRK